MIFEVLFRDESDWAGFRELPAVRAALDAVPDREAPGWERPERAEPGQDEPVWQDIAAFDRIAG